MRKRQSMRKRSVTRALGGFGVFVAVMSISAPAFGHVEAEGSTDAGGTTTVTFSFTHGCVESPTTSLRIQLPSNATNVQAESPSGWTAAVSGGELIWTGGSIANDAKGEFVATMNLAGSNGDTVFFPTIQGCVQGEDAWIDKSSDPEAENAAPRIVFGESATTTGDDHANEQSGSAVEAPTATASPVIATSPPANTASAAPASNTSDSSNLGLIIAIIAVVIVLGGGASVLAVRNRSKV
jgi:uncharacterized protein YcnI